MSEDQNNDLGTVSQASTEFVDEISADQSEQTSTSGVVFRQIMHKLQQLQKDEVDDQNRIRQALPLCNEMIDIVEQATPDDTDDFEKCGELLRQVLLVSELNTLLKDEKLLARELFFALLDLLCKPKIYLFLDDKEQIIPMHKIAYEHLTSLFLFLVTTTISFTPFIKDDIITRRYTDIFCIMYKRIERDLQTQIQAGQTMINENEIAFSILLLFSNMSDRTVIVPWWLGIGLIKSMLECLKVVDLSSETAGNIINIIYNTSRHDDGVEELNKLDGLTILRDIQSNSAEQLRDEDNLVIPMAIALLSTPEQIRSDNKRMNRILNLLLQLTMESAKADDHRGYNFHVSEALAVFTKLFVDDHSLEYVLRHAETDPQLSVSSTIALFADLLIEFRSAFADRNQLEQFTCTALLNILWSISFQDRYKTKLQQNKDLIKTVESLSMDNGEAVVDQYVPRSMESMTKAANGILDNLHRISDSKETVVIDIPLVSNTGTEKPTIMISYAHHNKSFCDKILNVFEKHQHLFEVWIDRDHLSSSDDLWEKIARGIRQSNLVVCLLSQDYFNSKSCRKEATFAIQRKKSIVPVYIGEPGDCDWLDIHIAGLKYVRFKGNNTELDRGKVQELLKTIQSTTKEIQTQAPQQQTEQHSIPTPSQTEPERTESMTFEMKKPPSEWTVDDIHNWFSNHKVPETLVKLCDFQSVSEMHEYAAKLRIDPKKEFNKYEQRYAKNHGEELEEYVFNRFRKTILKLPNHQPETVETLIPSAETPTLAFSYCTIL